MKKYNIVVVGGGFSGFAGAVAAARQGKSVLLIERFNCLGGVAAYNLVNPFMPYWTTDPDTGKRIVLSKGLFGEVIAELEKRNALRKDKMVFDTEYLKLILLKIAKESGVELLFQTYVSGASVENGEIKSLTVSNVGGSDEISADYFIDATGDANLAFLCGCPFTLGRETDNLCQPMTLCFRIGNVKKRNHGNINKNVDGRAGEPCDISAIDKLYRRFKEEGKIKNPREDVLMFKTVVDGVYHFNTTRVVKLDPTNAFDLTQAEIEAREQMFEIYDFLKENFSEFKDSVILSSGISIGVRESRKIIGEHVLTAEEIINCTVFDDSIAVCNYDIDIHSPDGSGTHHLYFKQGTYYTVPYRSLVPKGVNNLLVTGRCISATHEAQASVRTMPTCCTLGEASGIATSVALDENKSMREVDVQKIQSILRNSGAKIF